LLDKNLPVNFHKTMEQSQQHKKKQRSAKKNKQMGWMFSILAVLLIGMDFLLTPSPFGNAKIDNFAIARDTIANAKIVEKTHYSRYSSNKFYELDINTSSGQMFHLNRPDYPGQLTQYLAALPIRKEVSIRYFNPLFDGQRILDVRDDNHIYIPFSEIIADENHKRKFGLIATGIFALLGVIGFWFGREKQKPHISGHSEAHGK
jgi:hypothetical protein